MSYKKAIDVLPHSLLNAVQQYIYGQCIYIPRKEDKKQSWGQIHRQERGFKKGTEKFWPDAWLVVLLQS